MAMCAEELATARAAFGASAWVKEMEADGVRWDPSLWDGLRARTREHYVVGERSPFWAVVGARPDARVAVGTEQHWAVFFGKYARNSAAMAQGGAIAAIFDFAAACYGTVGTGTFGTYGLTKSLAVRYRRPALPVPGLFRVTVRCTAIDDQRGSLDVVTELSDGRGTVFATGEAVLVNKGGKFVRAFDMRAKL